MAISAGDWFPNDPFTRWEPLPDPRRPELPYRSGLSLTIRKHVPPQPYGITGYIEAQERQEAPLEALRALTQSEWCVRCPPTSTSPPLDPSVHQLHVIRDIACKDGRGPQIVEVYLDQDKSRTYVAKIFDPLYYAYGNRDAGRPVDVTWLADQHYSREAAAYEDLSRASVDGVLVPKYHGSWTFNVPLWSHHSRPVRMILMEWVPARSLHNLIGSRHHFFFSPQQRLEILARAMEIESRLSFHGVRHGDFAPRNVLLQFLGGTGIRSVDMDKLRILLVDFNHAVTISRPNCWYKRKLTTRPVNPRYRNWGGCPKEFLHWVPKPLSVRPAAFKGWLTRRWGGDCEEFAHRSEGSIKELDYDEEVEMVEPERDVIRRPG
ncbi:hypothetical protein QQS21_010062 [Conoideocrella luteorostrata]|uniref:non-specific serine/threonine protein kinase n=1 Tax=Conoideocrella luteorostrata TaxID=1105319 RepID=A0AAJ0CFX1_9HYPO|nr:hypothetical protein QQS21_010062 [Conoideocrella luteorostrata]